MQPPLVFPALTLSAFFPSRLAPSPLCDPQRLLPISFSKSAGLGTGNGDPVLIYLENIISM